jgi:hypothetical protein
VRCTNHVNVSNLWIYIHVRSSVFWDIKSCSPLTVDHIPEDRTLHNHHCENVKSYIIHIKFWRKKCNYSILKSLTLDPLCMWIIFRMEWPRHNTRTDSVVGEVRLVLVTRTDGHSSKRITTDRAYMSPCSLKTRQPTQLTGAVRWRGQWRKEPPTGGTKVLCKTGNEVWKANTEKASSCDFGKKGSESETHEVLEKEDKGL